MKENIFDNLVSLFYLGSNMFSFRRVEIGFPLFYMLLNPFVSL
jgi:hypothetical protein